MYNWKKLVFEMNKYLKKWNWHAGMQSKVGFNQEADSGILVLPDTD